MLERRPALLHLFVEEVEFVDHRAEIDVTLNDVRLVPRDFQTDGVRCRRKVQVGQSPAPSEVRNCVLVLLGAAPRRSVAGTSPGPARRSHRCGRTRPARGTPLLLRAQTRRRPCPASRTGWGRRPRGAGHGRYRNSQQGTPVPHSAVPAWRRCVRDADLHLVRVVAMPVLDHTIDLSANLVIRHPALRAGDESDCFGTRRTYRRALGRRSRRTGIRSPDQTDCQCPSSTCARRRASSTRRGGATRAQAGSVDRLDRRWRTPAWKGSADFSLRAKPNE